MAKRQTIGRVPDNRVAVVDHSGNVRGHVGRTATAATASRLLHTLGAKLDKSGPRPVWRGPKPKC